jgi:hypothetical protein
MSGSLALLSRQILGWRRLLGFEDAIGFLGEMLDCSTHDPMEVLTNDLMADAFALSFSNQFIAYTSLSRSQDGLLL